MQKKLKKTTVCHVHMTTHSQSYSPDQPTPSHLPRPKEKVNSANTLLQSFHVPNLLVLFTDTPTPVAQKAWTAVVAVVVAVATTPTPTGSRPFSCSHSLVREIKRLNFQALKEEANPKRTHAQMTKEKITLHRHIWIESKPERERERNKKQRRRKKSLKREEL